MQSAWKFHLQKIQSYTARCFAISLEEQKGCWPLHVASLVFAYNAMPHSVNRSYAHSKALAGPVNTASLNLATVQGGDIVFADDFLWLISLEEASPAEIR